MLIKRKITIPILSIIIFLLLLCSTKNVNANVPSHYGLSVSSTKGGLATSSEMNILYDDAYQLDAQNEQQYEFEYWEIDGDYELITGTLLDKHIQIQLNSNCRAKACFKATGAVEEREDDENSSGFISNNNNTNNSNNRQNSSFKAHAISSETIESETNTSRDKVKFGTLLAVLAVIIFAILSLSYLIKYSKVFYSVHIVKKRRKQRREY